MLYEKPKLPEPNARSKYAHLHRAIEEAVYTFGPSVTTRQVFWTLPMHYGGGRPTGVHPVDRPITRRRDKADAAKMLRQLKKAAEANVIDGEWTKDGYNWRLPRTNAYYRNNFSMGTTTFAITSPTTYATLTGGTW